MTYWKIESLKKLIEIEKNNYLSSNAKITRGYLDDLNMKIKLMEEAYNEGLKAKQQDTSSTQDKEVKENGH